MAAPQRKRDPEAARARILEAAKTPVGLPVTEPSR